MKRADDVGDRTPRRGRWAGLLLSICVGLVAGDSGCSGPTGNPTSLWLSYSQVETNVVLVDYEPPPF